MKLRLGRFGQKKNIIIILFTDEQGLTQFKQPFGVLQGSFDVPLLVDGVVEVVEHSHLIYGGLLSFVELSERLGHPQLCVVVIHIRVGDFRQLVAVLHRHLALVFYSWYAENTGDEQWHRRNPNHLFCNCCGVGFKNTDGVAVTQVRMVFIVLASKCRGEPVKNIYKNMQKIPKSVKKSMYKQNPRKIYLAVPQLPAIFSLSLSELLPPA